MSRLYLFLLSFVLASTVAAAQEPQEAPQETTPAQQTAQPQHAHAAKQCTVKTWVGREAEFEELLMTADVVSMEDIGVGVTKPHSVILKKGDLELKAAFKPIKRGRAGGFWESYEAEVAAYKLDQMLGLNMVPPTVVRKIDKRNGSLQFWVDDCKLYGDVMNVVPATPQWSHQLSRMKMFDNLILNEDRNARNFLVDPEHDIILIDHSRAFLSKKKIGKDNKLPTQYDRRLMERVQALEKEQLEVQLKDILMGGQIKAIIARRDKLVEHMEKMIAERGEHNVMFDEGTP
jgi:hypothetical protein